MSRYDYEYQINICRHMVGYKFNYVSTYNGLINVVGLMYNPIFLALLNIKSEKAYKLCRQNLNKWIGSLVVDQAAFCIKIFMMSCVKKYIQEISDNI